MSSRVPPHSLDAERAVIGCLMVRPDTLPDVIDAGLDASAFYAPRHGAAFAAIIALANRGDAVDAITVADELATGAYGVGPDANELVAATADTIPSSSHAGAYARRIADTARLRRGQHLGAAEMVDDGKQLAGS